MQESLFKRTVVLLVSLILMLAAASFAQEETVISGKITATYTKVDTIIVGDTEGHVLLLSESEGTNVSTGEHEFMDGAQVVNKAFGDFVKGNGSQQGYTVLTKGTDVVFVKWRGQVTTTISPEGTPLSTFEGTYSYIKGTGQCKNIQGGGTYKGRLISEKQFTVEWEGEYCIPK